MNKSWTKYIVTIAAVIVVFWLIGLAIRLAGWLLNLLLPVAALVLVVAIVMAWRRQKPRPSSSRQSLKISRDTSDNKK